ncbi:hypothetical protein Tco_1507069 [Tanacetum coccineum]
MSSVWGVTRIMSLRVFVTCSIVLLVVKRLLCLVRLCYVSSYRSTREKDSKGSWHEKGRSSSYSSSAFSQPSSSHPNDDDNDGNDEGTSRASTPSPTRFVKSLTNKVPRVLSNPPNIDPNMGPFYTYQIEILNRQVHLRDEQRSGILLIRIREGNEEPIKEEEEVRIQQKSQENHQKWANTDTRNGRVYKSQKLQSNMVKQSKKINSQSTLVKVNTKGQNPKIPF